MKVSQCVCSETRRTPAAAVPRSTRGMRSDVDHQGEADRRDFLHFVFFETGRLCVCVCVCVCVRVCVCVHIQKVVERFHRNKSKPANEDVAERVFLLAERRIEVTYHLEDHRFIPSKRSFIKPRESTEKKKAEDFTPDMVSGFQVPTVMLLVDFSAACRITRSHNNYICVCAQVDPSEKPPETLILYRLLVNLMKDEDTVVHQIRGSQKEVTTSSVSPVPLHRSDIYSTSTNCQVKHFIHHTYSQRGKKERKWRTRLHRPQRPSPSEDPDLSWDSASVLPAVFVSCVCSVFGSLFISLFVLRVNFCVAALYFQNLCLLIVFWIIWLLDFQLPLINKSLFVFCSQSFLPPACPHYSCQS